MQPHQPVVAALPEHGREGLALEQGVGVLLDLVQALLVLGVVVQLQVCLGLHDADDRGDRHLLVEASGSRCVVTIDLLPVAADGSGEAPLPFRSRPNRTAPYPSLAASRAQQQGALEVPEVVLRRRETKRLAKCFNNRTGRALS